MLWRHGDAGRKRLLPPPPVEDRESRDLRGIYLKIAFSGAPLYVTLLPPPVGWLVVGTMAVCAAAGCLLVFSPIELGRHLRTAVYCVMGLAHLLPVHAHAHAHVL